MPLFTENHRKFFNCETGAFSEVTTREATGDKSVTIDKFEKSVLAERYQLDSFTRVGGGQSDGKPQKHAFNVISIKDGVFSTHELALKYPKGKGNELRLYFRDGTGFYPKVDSVWFIFTRSGNAKPFIGFLTIDEWVNLTTGDELSKQFEIDYGEDEEDAEYQKAVNSPKAQKGAVEIVVTQYPRDATMAARVIKEAGYVCQYNNEHETFISASTGSNYIEAHHLVPMSKTNLFEKSLDVEENIISLCPRCHRLIHYAIATEKKEMVGKFFSKREDAIAECGIDITLDVLLSFYGVEE